ncbi:DUF3800 domain-containing protein [Nocardioides jejuensis]|uniref:DUF3800 domain-containing protein n=1 Tax=Nocardioides jejuensis TaxID=2502782 RepID=A0A4R1CLX3_9ACTN|nr:DUF3800 domain-containing protein [Nocardioides jejuensis]TCJ31048.1 DUF3800 domain-containing protein [Nocardioides jejuensis]
MAKIVYIDETGSAGRGAKQQDLLTVVGVLAPADRVRDLDSALRAIEKTHFQLMRIAPREFHGVEIWNGTGQWASKTPPERLSVLEDVISLIPQFDIHIAHASIHKPRLASRWGADGLDRAYLLALQFLLEKVDAFGSEVKIVVADEAKEHQLTAAKMVGDLRNMGYGEVSGRVLSTIVDTVHFVDSKLCAGVQLADVIAYLMQRTDRGTENHPDVQAARTRMMAVIRDHTVTWREPWPRAPQ